MEMLFEEASNAFDGLVLVTDSLSHLESRSWPVSDWKEGANCSLTQSTYRAVPRSSCAHQYCECGSRLAHQSTSIDSVQEAGLTRKVSKRWLPDLCRLSRTPILEVSLESR